MTVGQARRLDAESFARVVRDTPLVSIDLVVRPPDDTVLLGFRNNEPARDHWFVPGGRVCKDERLAAAFERITGDELGAIHTMPSARPLGVFEHLYPTNFSDEPGYGTHYVVLGYELRIDRRPEHLPVEQHSRYRWFTVDELLGAPDVHPNTKAYFTT